MKKRFLPLIAIVASFAVFGCSDTKTPATEKTAEPAKPATEPAENAAAAEVANVVQVAKTIKLANGASVTWIQDNQDEKLNPRSLFSDASDSLFASLNLPDGIPASVSVFLLQVDGKNILFDAGLGAFGGQMLNRLEALGVTPENVNFIYLTHFHADHIAGMIAKDSAGKDVRVFNNATVYAGKVEYDAWMNDIAKNDLQKVIMGIYKDSLHLFAFGDTLPQGVIALDAVGHTPGHTAFQFSNLLVIGDLMHGYALQKDHPEINSNYDMDKEKSIESRKRLMQYARDNKLTMAGMHLPPPGFAE
ncbi:MBL fold metallo-hydrolase [Fibrobacter sp.]|uniref:MBL fold metallo-hydrolase n=1 Tax=Fibrobacter sp. TaxID=35828 RepID=UPI003862E766